MIALCLSNFPCNPIALNPKFIFQTHSCRGCSRHQICYFQQASTNPKSTVIKTDLVELSLLTHEVLDEGIVTSRSSYFSWLEETHEPTHHIVTYQLCVLQKILTGLHSVHQQLLIPRQFCLLVLLQPKNTSKTVTEFAVTTTAFKLINLACENWEKKTKVLHL